MSNPNIITADEMAVALDSQAPVTPAKFLPYKKVLDELISIQSIVEEDAELFAELASLFGQMTTSGDSHTHLASLGRRLARSHADTLLEIVETSTEVTTSAKRTMPRKRWDDDGCPDDRPDDDDLARESAAAVSSNDGDAET
jgi:hypothetical protein